MKILINDGIHPTGKRLLEEAGFEVSTNKIAQDDLPAKLNEYDAICVRSATKVRKDLIDQSPNLKAICRGGVGLDNIDVDYARSKGIHVINTPAASSRSVAELVFAHLFSIARFLQQANREMPVKGNSEFKDLKKNYSAGVELTGRTLGIIGFGRIGQETASIALGVGMNVIAVDPYLDSAEVSFGPTSHQFKVKIETSSMDEMLKQADAITLHVPFLGEPVLGTKEFDQMKEGVFIANASRGGTIDEDALLAALESGKVAAAALDVFVGEPKPRVELLSHPNISLTPHIGASTGEAQEKIGIELAEKLIAALKD
ncbi:D-2-hydroxyacid dehydrogenase [Portibacter marinus]|uniref:D-2-hydroxyacid dehydrogenase n=1 Tax=Portibacter marinus TaxID=2898660 RepID=UPI001F24B20C|nr:D-2-hydroxyacid dehydrogenase [Portibacter marinus]